mgnify:FL=1
MKTVTFPKFDMETFFAMQKANMDTMVKAQNVMLEAFQAAAKVQYGFVNEYFEQAQSLMSGKFDADKKPEAYVADVKAVADKVVTVAQTQMDLGMKAQAEAMDLLSKRAQKNVDELQKLAA